MPRKSRKKKAVQEDPQDPINASLGQLRRQNERLRKEIINIRSGKEIIREVVEDIYNRNPDRFYFDVPDVPQALKKRKKQPSEIAVLHLSDIHVGKRALDVTTPIPTPDGWKTMGELRDGDTVFDDFGSPTQVVKAHPVLRNQQCYKIQFNTGDEIVADAGHLWLVTRNTTHVKGEEVLTTQELYERLVKYKQKIRVRVAGALDCSERELPLPPYALGAWLGDGFSSSSGIGVHEDDSEIFDYIEEDGLKVSRNCYPTSPNMIKGSIAFDWQRADECYRGHDLAVHRNKHGACRVCASNASMRWRGSAVAVLPPKRRGFAASLSDLGLKNNKHIPQEYLRGSISQRLSLLQGLMDTDGYCNKQGFSEIISKFPLLADGIYELIVSLGMKPRQTQKWVEGKVYQRITFKPTLAVFRLERKAKRLADAPSAPRQSLKAFLRCIESIEPVESVPVRCITVNTPSSLYLAGRGMIPTHNTASFDSTVCAERMRFLTEKVLRITDMRRVNASIDEIRVYLGGDMIEGETIFGGQAHEIDSNLFEQTILNAPEILTALVLNLLKSFKKVRIATVPGNHGRSGSKYSGAAKKTNWDRVFYAILKTNLLGTDQYPREDLMERLSWLENHESFWVVDRVYDWGNLIFHGDQIKGGFAGFPWYGAAKKLWGYIDLIPPQWDYAYIGHFHTPAMVVLNHRILLANGTFESDNEFALEQLASGGFPCQRLAYYNEDHGLISDNPIWLVENRVPHLMRPSVR